MLRFPLILIFCAALSADPLDDLARDFWAWRAIHQPITGDDIPRIDRPVDWTPDWSPQSVAQQRDDLAVFEKRWKEIDAGRWAIPRQVDYRLIGSALARVGWELYVTHNWQRDPSFYIDQSLGAVLDRLLQPPPIDPVRSGEILRRMSAIPRVIEDAKANLDRTSRPFAELAITSLKDIRPRLLKAAAAIKPLLDPTAGAPFDTATDKAAAALESFSQWLTERLPSMSKQTAIGRKNYAFFLKSVALMPYSPDQILAMGESEWQRAVSFETYEKQRNAGLPQLALPANQAEQIARERRDEAAVREHLSKRGFLTFPAWLQHYWNLPLPAYFSNLPAVPQEDDLTGPTRLKKNSTSYIFAPAPSLGFFQLV